MSAQASLERFGPNRYQANTRYRPAMLALIRERGLKTSGFRKALRTLIDDIYTDHVVAEMSENDGDSYDPQEMRDLLFYENFGDIHVIPTAFKISRIPIGHPDFRADRRANFVGLHVVTIDIYEVEGSQEIGAEKLCVYGHLADVNEAVFNLHILDKYDNEIVIEHDYLMGFMTIGLAGFQEYFSDKMKAHRAKARAQHHATIVVDESGAEQRRNEIATLRKQLASINESHIASTLQDVIYGLGRGMPHKDIAAKLGVDIEVVRGTARLLEAKTLDPKVMVKDTHTRWKIAYDAVREMGIEI